MSEQFEKDNRYGKSPAQVAKEEGLGPRFTAGVHEGYSAGHSDGFQAGLKRAAELAHNWGEAADHQADYDFSNAAKNIEQAILKEANYEDASKSR